MRAPKKQRGGLLTTARRWWWRGASSGRSAPPWAAPRIRGGTAVRRKGAVAEHRHNSQGGEGERCTCSHAMRAGRGQHEAISATGQHRHAPRRRPSDSVRRASAVALRAGRRSTCRCHHGSRCSAGWGGERGGGAECDLLPGARTCLGDLPSCV